MLLALSIADESGLELEFCRLATKTIKKHIEIFSETTDASSIYK